MLRQRTAKEAAIKFLEYLASDQASVIRRRQRQIAGGRTSQSQQPRHSNRSAKFKADKLPVKNLAMYQAKAG